MSSTRTEREDRVGGFFAFFLTRLTFLVFCGVVSCLYIAEDVDPVPGLAACRTSRLMEAKGSTGSSSGGAYGVFVSLTNT